MRKYVQEIKVLFIHFLFIQILDIVQKDLVYLYPTTTRNPAERSSMAVTVVVSVLSSFFVLAFITLVIWQLKNRNVANRKTSQHISSPGGQRNVSLDTKETTKINCPCDDSRPSHRYTSSQDVSTDLTHPGFDCNVLQRESTASTIIFDINSCTYEPVLYAVEEDRIARVWNSLNELCSCIIWTTVIIVFLWSKTQLIKLTVKMKMPSIFAKWK